MQTITTTQSGTEAVRNSSFVGAAISLLFLVLLTLLHVIKPELEPSWRMVSEYAIGRHGWVMTVAFLAMAVSCALLVFGVRALMPTLGGKIGVYLLRNGCRAGGGGRIPDGSGHGHAG